VQYASDIASWVSPAQRLNQEVVRIRNNGAVPLSVDGWTLRVGNDRTRRVPPGGPIPPGQSIDVHVGSGTNTATDRYLGSGTALMYAASLDGGPHLGSGSYLIDPDNDIRASMTWPCTLDCADPTGDDLVISEVVADAPGGMDTKNLNGEYVRITNRGSAPIRTGDIVMESLPVVVEFPGDHWLAPGESVVVRSGKGDSTQDTRYVGADSGLLNSSGDRVLLRTYDAIVVDCYSWGRGPNSTCPRG
jgi:hypothetical protein